MAYRALYGLVEPSALGITDLQGLAAVCRAYRALPGLIVLGVYGVQRGTHLAYSLGLWGVGVQAWFFEFRTSRPKP